MEILDSFHIPSIEINFFYDKNIFQDDFVPQQRGLKFFSSKYI